MKYNSLLNRQIEKYSINEILAQFPELEEFLVVVNKSYDQFEKDKLLAQRSFEISESEYLQVNKRLIDELKKNQISISKLTEAVGVIKKEKINLESEDIVSLADIINDEIKSRKHAESMFDSLTSNLKNGILLENKNREIQYANLNLLEIFGIKNTELSLKGVDCNETAQNVKNLFTRPEDFIDSIEKCVSQKEIVIGEEFEMTNGRVFLRDYIPLHTEGFFDGHLWSYTEITDIRIKDKKLAESEKWNRKIMNSALDAIITIDISSKITFWNPQAEKIFGYTNQEAIGKPLNELIIPKVHHKGHLAGIEAYILHGHGPVLNKQIELPAVNKLGQEIIIELYIIPISDGDQKYFCSFIRDVTDKKQMLQEKDRLSLVASANLNGILFLNKKDEIFWCNDGFLKMTEYNYFEIMEVPLKQLFKSPNPGSEHNKKLYSDYKEGKSISLELNVYRKDGSWFWARIKGQSLESDNAASNYFFMIEDITQERETRKLLKDYEEKLKIALNSVGDNYWEHDFDLDVTTFLNPANEFLGYNISEIGNNKAKFWWERIHPQDKHILESLDSEYKSGKRKDHNKEYRVIKKDGSYLWVIDRGTVIEFHKDGKPKKIIGTHIDISNQKKLETELIQAKEAAESSTRTKEMFLANMSHEIRTPMNAIVGMANQLKKSTLTEKQDFYLNTLQSSAENLLVIINDILDLSKIEAGELTIEKIGFEPKKVLANVMQVMTFKAEEKGLYFSNSFCDSRLSPILIGDPYRLNQIFLNLVSNAIKFTNKGGVDILCAIIEDHIDHQVLEGRVIDTGIGIDEKFIKNIFQKFKQEDDSVTRKFGGTGLGMSICKNLIELMGGKIFVESEKGKGTTVFFRIPLQKGTEADLPKQINTNYDISKLKNKTILVADDNEMNRLVAATILENLGVKIIEAENGLQAVEKVKLFNPDLVLMDIQMPIMDGLEATRTLRLEYDKNLPIIALTAIAIKGEELKFKEAGMNDFVLKPFQEERLLQVIADYFRIDKLENQATIEDKESVELFNLSKLESLSGGNQSFIKKMIDLFVTLSSQSVTQINEAYDQNDFVQVGKLAHKLKPSLDNLSIDSLKETIKDIEKNAKDYGKSDKLKSLITQVQKTVEAVNAQLQNIK
jgi:PAS domain S-box-containing protein